MSGQVTRPKNEGRVAAGKRLAEWNRKNKGQVESSDNSSAKEPLSQTSTVVYGSGALAVLAVIGVALYLYHEKPVPNAKATPTPEPDIFCMR